MNTYAKMQRYITFVKHLYTHGDVGFSGGVSVSQMLKFYVEVLRFYSFNVLD